MKEPLELKKCLQRPPILTYPFAKKAYYLFTDASKYCEEATLCQYTKDSNNLDSLKPITFLTGKFLGTQCNYTTFVREAFVIYMSLTFRMQNAPFYVITSPQKNF